MPIASVPADTVVPPEYVLALLNTSVPAPFFNKLAPPLPLLLRTPDTSAESPPVPLFTVIVRFAAVPVVHINGVNENGFCISRIRAEHKPANDLRADVAAPDQRLACAADINVEVAAVGRKTTAIGSPFQIRSTAKRERTSKAAVSLKYATIECEKAGCRQAAAVDRLQMPPLIIVVPT